MESILQLIESNSLLTTADLAVMCSVSEAEIKEKIAQYERDGIIVGYKTLIDWDKTDREYVSAMIELKVAPKKDIGFDHIAEKICLYPQVQSVSLMSGSYDLLVLIEERTMREVSNFVFKKLAPMEGIVSTATHFIMRKYKDKGMIYSPVQEDKRGNIL